MALLISMVCFRSRDPSSIYSDVFAEFCKMMTTPTKDVDFEAEMKSAFKVFDHDNSGTISLDELRRVMRSFGEILTEDELDAMIKEVDKDGDGSIDCMFSLNPHGM